MERVSLTQEYIFRASPAILYQFFTTPSRLNLWFCDSVDIDKDLYTFEWSGSEEQANLIDDIEDELIKFSWLDNDPDEFLEFRIEKSPVTGETILNVTDFCDDDEVEDQKQYWDNLMSKLKKATGG